MIDPKIVIGLGFGDEGTGMAVAHEVEKSIADGHRPVVVRFNGGPQAQHNVRIVCDGKVIHHTHSQFGSGALLGAKTYIAKGMLVDLDALIWEGEHLRDITGENPFTSVVIDKRCPVMLPMYARVNQELEYGRGDKRHGSTGRGVGIARACIDAEPISKTVSGAVVRVSDVLTGRYLMKQLEAWPLWLSREYGVSVPNESEIWAYDLCKARDKLMILGVRFDYVDELVKKSVESKQVIFEGSQGVLLDKRVGWFPHVTYGDMDAFEARRLCGEHRAKVIGVTRSYQTRHGFGPMPTEGTCDIPEIDNETYEWAGVFRTGLLDIPNLARAADSTCVDEIAVSHMDSYPGRCVTRWEGTSKVDGIDRYVPCGMCIEDMDEDTFISTIEDECHAPVTVIGRGPITDAWQDR